MWNGYVYVWEIVMYMYGKFVMYNYMWNGYEHVWEIIMGNYYVLEIVMYVYGKLLCYILDI